MRHRLVYVASIVLASGFVAAGCGGGSDSSTTSTTAAGVTGATGPAGPPLSEQAFLTQGNEICKQGNKEIDAAFGSLGVQKGEEPTQQQITQVAEQKVIPSIQGQIDDFRALTPPANLQADVTKFLDDAQSELDKVKADPTLLTQGNAFSDVNAEANAIGLDQCAS